MANRVEIIINADGTRAIKAMQDVSATARSTSKANREASQATALAAKFAGDSVKTASTQIIVAREKERAAAKDYARIQALVHNGTLEETAGVRAMAAAYQRLTLAKMASAKASEKHISAMGGGHEWTTLRQHLAGGLTFGSSLGETAPMLAAAAAVTEAGMALKSAVTEALAFGEEMQRASEKTGLAVGTLSVLHYAAAVTGGDFDQLTKAVSRMDVVIAQATEGNKRAAAFLATLGYTSKQSMKELADSPQGAEIAFRKLAATLAATESAQRRNELASEYFGMRAGAQQIATLIEVGAHWDELTQQTKASGRYMDEMSAQKLEDVNKKLKKMGEQLDGMKLSIGEGFIGPMGQMIDVIESSKGPLGDLDTLGRHIAQAFALVGDAIYSAISASHMMAAGVSGGKLTPWGRNELALADAADVKARKMWGIVSGEPSAAPVVAAPKAPAESGRRAGAAFGGIGDLSRGKDPNAARLKAEEAQLHEMQLQQPMSAKSEYDYWQQKKSAYKTGSDQYNAIVAKQATIAEAAARRAHTAIEAYKKKQIEDPGAGARALAAGERGQLAMTKDRYEQQRSAYAMQRDADASNRQAQLKLSEFYLRSHSVSAGGGERQLAALHQQMYDAAQGSLSDQAASVRNDPYLAAKERDAQLQRLQQEQERLAQEREIQAAEDQMRIESTTLLGGANDALRQFVLDSTNAGAAMQRWLGGSIDTVNGEIVKSLTTPAHLAGGADWGAAGHQIFTAATGSLLTHMEGSVLGKLGIGGKKDGSSQANALWVQMASKASSSTASAGTTVAGLVGSMASGVSSSSPGTSSTVGSTVSKVAQFAMNLIPGFAEGGQYPTNSLIRVGEQGPEIMRTGSTAGTIIPNHALGGTTIHLPINVDARGATNPAEVEAAGYRGAMRAAPQIHAAVMQSIHERRVRRPLTAK